MGIWPRLFDASGLEAIPRSGKMDGFPECPALATSALIARSLRALTERALRASKRARCQGAANGKFLIASESQKICKRCPRQCWRTGMNVMERFSLNKADDHSRLLFSVGIGEPVSELESRWA